MGTAAKYPAIEGYSPRVTQLSKVTRTCRGEERRLCSSGEAERRCIEEETGSKILDERRF